MPAVCVIGSPISCGDTMAGGSGNVMANGIPITRVGPDLTAGHCFAPTPIASGSSKVFINGLPCARVEDPIVAHTCPPIPSTHGGTVSNGSPNVVAGG